MELLGDVLGMATSAASGGLFGLIGSLVNRVGTYFETRQKQAFEEKKWGHEIALQELQMKARAEETEQEIILANAEGSWNGLEASIRADADIGDSYKWVNAVRGLFRPVITLILWGFVALIMYWITGKSLIDYLPSADMGEIVRYIVYSVVFTAVTATVWWFGDRAPAPTWKK